MTRKLLFTGELMHKSLLLCSLIVALAGASALAADGFPNPGFENGTKDGWTVGGRKDANAKVVSSKPFFDSLRNDKGIRSSGGWESHPLAAALDRKNNKFLLRISSNGYITAATQSSVKIESGSAEKDTLTALFDVTRLITLSGNPSAISIALPALRTATVCPALTFSLSTAVTAAMVPDSGA